MEESVGLTNTGLKSARLQNDTTARRGVNLGGASDQNDASSRMTPMRARSKSVVKVTVSESQEISKLACSAHRIVVVEQDRYVSGG